MTLRKHSVSIQGHSTSFSIEDEFWDEFCKIAQTKEMPLARLVTQIDAARVPGRNLSSAIRVFVLENLKSTDRSGVGVNFPTTASVQEPQ